MDKNVVIAISAVAENKNRQKQLLLAATFVRNYLDQEVSVGFQSKVHGWNHMKLVALKTIEYIKKEGGSEEEQQLGLLAGLFHDIIRPKPKLQKEDDLLPEVQSAEMADKILHEIGFFEDEIKTVKDAITGHSFGVEVKGNRQTKTASGLVSDCLIAADKVRQYQPAIIKEREIFIKESNDNISAKQVEEYWKRRIQKAEEFLDTKQGKIMLRHEPHILQDFEKVKQYFVDHVKNFN